MKQRDALNFRQTLKDMKKSIKIRKWRGLALLGKIQIVKTFAVSKIMYRASVIQYCAKVILTIIDEYRDNRDLLAIFER